METGSLRSSGYPGAMYIRLASNSNSDPPASISTLVVLSYEVPCVYATVSRQGSGNNACWPHCAPETFLNC